MTKEPYFHIGIINLVQALKNDRVHKKNDTQPLMSFQCTRGFDRRSFGACLPATCVRDFLALFGASSPKNRLLLRNVFRRESTDAPRKVRRTVILGS